MSVSLVDLAVLARQTRHRAQAEALALAQRVNQDPERDDLVTQQLRTVAYELLSLTIACDRVVLAVRAAIRLEEAGAEVRS